MEGWHPILRGTCVRIEEEEEEEKGPLHIEHLAVTSAYRCVFERRGLGLAHGCVDDALPALSQTL